MADKYFYIPANFAEEGTIFSGRIKTRNAVETAVLILIFIQPLIHLEMLLKMRIYVGIILILPIAILGILGIQGQSLTAFLLSFFSFLKNRRVLTYPTDKEVMALNRKNIRLQQKLEKKKRKEVSHERNKRAEAAVPAGEEGSEAAEKGCKKKCAAKSQPRQKVPGRRAKTPD